MFSGGTARLGRTRRRRSFSIHHESSLRRDELLSAPLTLLFTSFSKDANNRDQKKHHPDRVEFARPSPVMQEKPNSRACRNTGNTQSHERPESQKHRALGCRDFLFRPSPVQQPLDYAVAGSGLQPEDQLRRERWASSRLHRLIRSPAGWDCSVPALDSADPGSVAEVPDRRLCRSTMPNQTLRPDGGNHILECSRFLSDRR